MSAIARPAPATTSSHVSQTNQTATRTTTSRQAAPASAAPEEPGVFERFVKKIIEVVKNCFAKLVECFKNCRDRLCCRSPQPVPPINNSRVSGRSNSAPAVGEPPPPPNSPATAPSGTEAAPAAGPLAQSRRFLRNVQAWKSPEEITVEFEGLSTPEETRAIYLAIGKGVSNSTPNGVADGDDAYIENGKRAVLNNPRLLAEHLQTSFA